MKIGKTVGVFAVTPPAPPPSGESGSVSAPEDAKPELTPVEFILPNGKVIGISPFLQKHALTQFAKVDWSTASQLAAAEQTSQELPKAAVPEIREGAEIKAAALPAPGSVKPAVVGMAPSAPVGATAEDGGLWGRSKGALGFVSGSTTVVNLAEGLSHAQVVHAATASGLIAQPQADTLADTAMNILHSHGGHATLVAVRIGGFAGAIAVLLGYKKQAAVVTIIAGVGALILLSLFGREQNPLVGKWNLNAIETNYQSGTPPRQAVEEISEDKNGLKIASTAIEEGGQRESSAVEINPDGKPHTTDQGDLVVATMKDHTLQAEHSRNGQIVETEVRTLSPDEKKMTVTTLGRTPTGAPYKDVAVYDRD